MLKQVLNDADMLKTDVGRAIDNIAILAANSKVVGDSQDLRDLAISEICQYVKDDLFIDDYIRLYDRLYKKYKN